MNIFHHITGMLQGQEEPGKCLLCHTLKHSGDKPSWNNGEEFSKHRRYRLNNVSVSLTSARKQKGMRKFKTADMGKKDWKSM